MTVGPLQIVILALVVLLLFGRRLAGLGTSLGRAIGSFRRAVGGSERAAKGAVPADLTKAWQMVRAARRLRRFPFSFFR
ncbi:MAG TPA: twin-arginine translocase TatA/TatE family subunit [Polyangiaceae bacterium]|jgi:TatA/E family protein of Tat protein translocase